MSSARRRPSPLRRRVSDRGARERLTIFGDAFGASIDWTPERAARGARERAARAS